MQHCFALYEWKTGIFLLQDVSFEIEKGELRCVQGRLELESNGSQYLRRDGHQRSGSD